MSFWTEVLRPVLKIAGAVGLAVAGYVTGAAWYYSLASVFLQAGIADHQAQRAKKAARNAYNAAQRDRQQMVSSATNPRQDVYGRTVCSGTVLFKHSSGPKKEFLYIAVELARHEIDAIESIWIGETEIPSTLWDANGWVTGGPFNKGQVTLVTESRTGPGTIAAPHGVYRIVSAIRMRADGPVDITSLATASGTTITVGGTAHTDVVKVSYEWTEGKPMVRVYTALGSPDQTAFAAWQTEIGTRWTAQHRLRGRAAVGLRLEYDQDVFGQLRDLNIKALVRGKKILDPRTGMTVYSNNSALVTADIMRTRMGATAAQLPSAELIAEANICDQLVAIDTVGGTQRRYTCDIAISTAVAPRESLDLATETMAGSVVWVQGRWLIRAGAWRTPTITLTAADLAEGPRQITPRAQRKGLANAVVATYTEPDLAWVLNPAPEMTSSYYLAQDSGRKLPMQISLEGVTDSVRAQRLAKIELERVRNGGTFAARFSANAYDCMPGEVINLQMDRYFGATPKAYQVIDRKLDLQSLEIDLTLRETAASIYEWNGGMPTLVDLTPNTDLPNPLAVPDALTGVSVTSGNSTLLQLSDGTILARARVSWTQHTSAFVTHGGYIDIEWTRVGDTTWISTGQVAGDATTALVGPIDDQAAVLIRLRAVNAAGRASYWLTLPHIVAGKSAPPTAPTALAVTESAGGQRIFALAHAQDVDHAGYLVRYSAVLAASFAGMTLTAAEWSGPGKIGQSSLPADGTWLFAAVAVDSSGNYSDPVYTTATLTAIHALAAASGGNQLFNGDFGFGWLGWTSSHAGFVADRLLDSPGSTIAQLSPISGSTAVLGQGAPVSIDGAYQDEWSDPIPVKEGHFYCASAFTGSVRARNAVFAYFFNKDGAVVGHTYGPALTCENNNEYTGGESLNEYKRVYGAGQAPAAAVTARVALRKYNTGAGYSSSYMTMCRVMFEEVLSASATPGPWAPGPIAYTGDLDATNGAPAGTIVGSILAQNVESIAGAQAKADAAHAAAVSAAAADAAAKANLAEVTAKAYADGVVDAEEARAIADATAKANAAQASAVVAAAADATAKADAAAMWAVATAGADAAAKASLAEITAKAYADGVVDAEEARAIADATAKANAARAAAEAAAAADATAKANVAATTALWAGVADKPEEQANLCWNGVGQTVKGWAAGVSPVDFGPTGYWYTAGVSGARYALYFNTQQYTTFGDVFTVRKDEVYSFSADCVHAGAATGGYDTAVGFILYAADGSTIGFYAGATLLSSIAYQEIKGSYTIPQGAAKAIICVRLVGLSGFEAFGNGAYYTNIVVRRAATTNDLVPGAATSVVNIAGNITSATGSAGSISGFGTGWIAVQLNDGDIVEVTLTVTDAQANCPDPDYKFFFDTSWCFSDQTRSFGRSSQYTYKRHVIQVPATSSIGGVACGVSAFTIKYTLESPLARSYPENITGLRSGVVSFNIGGGCYAGYLNQARNAHEIGMTGNYQVSLVVIRR